MLAVVVFNKIVANNSAYVVAAAMAPSYNDDGLADKKRCVLFFT